MIDRTFAHALLERHGSPLYVYDLDVARARASELLALLPAGARLFYSLKTNPIVELCAELRAAGCAVELSSTPELTVARAAGFDPDEVLYSGPGKTARSNREALEAGVRAFTADSWTDLARLSASAVDLGVTARSLLRIDISGDEAYRDGMGARSSHFGVDAATLTSGATERLAGLDGVELLGIHVYAGTQLPDAAALGRTFRRTIELAERVARAGVPVRVVDLGGGFPWPFATAGTAPDLSPLREELADAAGARSATAAAELWFESGRYLAASCGTLLATVLDVKTATNGRRTVVIDAGTSHLGGLSGLGLIHRAVADVRPLDEPRADEREAVDVVGPTDSPLDRVARGATVPPLEPGDVVTVPNVGAYGLTASLVAFAGRESPAEVCCRGTEEVAAYRWRAGHERATASLAAARAST